jgi:Uncharacterized protein conserved in bacteria
MLEDLSIHDVTAARIVRNGNIIAIEAAEGTDGMLERAASLSHGRSGRQKPPSFFFGQIAQEKPRHAL